MMVPGICIISPSIGGLLSLETLPTHLAARIRSTLLHMLSGMYAYAVSASWYFLSNRCQASTLVLGLYLFIYLTCSES